MALEQHMTYQRQTETLLAGHVEPGGLLVLPRDSENHVLSFRRPLGVFYPLFHSRGFRSDPVSIVFRLVYVLT